MHAAWDRSQRSLWAPLPVDDTLLGYDTDSDFDSDQRDDVSVRDEPEAVVAHVNLLDELGGVSPEHVSI